MTARHIRAARALLDWSIDRLADECGLSRRTVIRVENEELESRAGTLGTIRAALESAGIEFLNHNRPGVRLRR